MNKEVRLLLGRLLLLGAYSGFFWGIVYPELCLTEDICVTAEGEEIDFSDYEDESFPEEEVETEAAEDTEAPETVETTEE